MLNLLILAQLAASLFMTGLIWLVQLVHYPLFAAVGKDSYLNYHKEHIRRMSWVVVPVMTLELITAVQLCFVDLGSEQELAIVALISLGVAWISTAVFSVPCHEALSRRFDPAVHRRLVRTNWFRALAWTIRSVILLVLLFERLSL